MWLLCLGAARQHQLRCCRRKTPHTITVAPGQNIQQTVDNAPEGTRFVFAPGIYRQQTIIPKDRQQFIGQDGVILNGAMALTDWTQVAGLWQTDGLPAPLDFHGECDDGREFCHRREDLFVNDHLYKRVRALAGLAPGSGTTRTVAPGWPTTRPGSWSSLASPPWPSAAMPKMSCSRI